MLARVNRRLDTRNANDQVEEQRVSDARFAHEETCEEHSLRDKEHVGFWVAWATVPAI